jgi:hypothetical protein
MRATMWAALALALGSATLPAQDSSRTTVLFQPTATTYTFGEGTAARTVEQAAMPLAFVFPIHRRFTMDFTTAAAYTRVVHGDSTVSEIYGATDSQLRANVHLLMDRLMLTLGINGPSGQYYVDSTQLEAAARIGNDFLFYPISSMGNGAGATAGLALGVQLFNWNVGLGGSLRKSMEFVPFGSGTEEFRYQPGDETRLRLTAERALWVGTASLGVTYSTFGDEVADATTYATGDRTITSAAWSLPIWKVNLLLNAWNLARDKGQQLGGVAPRESIRNYAAVLTVPLFRWSLQPTIESRRWERDGDRAGTLRNYGISIGIPVGATGLLQPSFTTSSGRLYSGTDASSVPITGWQASLLLRRR